MSQTMLRYDADHQPPIPSHSHRFTRMLVKLFTQGRLDDVTCVEVEAEYGHLARITYRDGSSRITYPWNAGLNPAAAARAANDKGHSKALLRAAGINCPAGTELLMPQWAEKLRAKGWGPERLRTTDLIAQYAKGLGYPVYIKPVDGALGTGVHKVRSPDQFPAILDDYATDEVRVVVLEEAVDLPDYRITVLDGDLLDAYQRIPLTVRGDGHHTIAQLLHQRLEVLARTRDITIDADDPRIGPTLTAQGLHLHDTPAAGTDVPVLPISNMSAGGIDRDIAATIHPRWVDLARTIARQFGLRLCGIDLLCEDPARADARYSVLEVNPYPGVNHYDPTGTRLLDITGDLHARILNAPSTSPTPVTRGPAAITTP